VFINILIFGGGLFIRVDFFVFKFGVLFFGALDEFIVEGLFGIISNDLVCACI